MKKILSLMLIIATVFTSLTVLSSCGKDELFYYGVVEKERNLLLVNIPNIGRCEIPEAKKITTEVNGKRKKISALEVGDLIRLNFGKIDDVSVLERYPAAFSENCKEITVCAKGIEVEYEYSGTTPVCYLTQSVPASLAGARIGDYIGFFEGGNLYCTAEVYMTLPDGKLVLRVELFDGISEFLSKYSSCEQRIINMY